ncbi:hypothetical protein ASE80_27375 [Pseudomonas sp. Leaf15]|nr:MULTISPECIES: hypothetical protein [unclassified Pseudomonas]KQM52104.1 hypothetical protein ASE80_27375 [Pseudomonas sp. Leaf15]
MRLTDALEVFNLKGIFVHHQCGRAVYAIDLGGLGRVQQQAFHAAGVFVGNAIEGAASSHTRLAVRGSKQHDNQRVCFQDALVFVKVMNNRLCSAHDDLLVCPANSLRVR